MKKNLILMQQLLGGIFLGGLMCTHVHAVSVQSYANTCKTELGIVADIPGFDCERGMLMPTSQFGKACDAQATLPDAGCREGTRLGQVAFSTADVKGVFICRKYVGVTLGAEQYNDIAMIVSNKSTGKTCFFQSPTTGALPRNVPSPNSSTANTIWLNNMNPSGCTSCHANDPYIVTPFVISGFNRMNLTGFNPLGDYKVVKNGSSGYSPDLSASTPTADNTCTQCHRTAAVAHNSAWMSSKKAEVNTVSGLWNIKNKGIRGGAADSDVFRPSDGRWFHREADGQTSRDMSWGQTGDKALKGDFDGDGQTDVSIWRSSTKQFWVFFSSTGGAWNTTFGETTDIPAIADYDGDGRDDLALYRPSNGDWLIIDWASWSFGPVNIGKKGTPVPADYDGDLKANLAVYANTSDGLGHWYVKEGSTVVDTQWGLSGMTPVPADYTGDAIVDRASFRPSDGNWSILPSKNHGSSYGLIWGKSGDIPVPADYDGDSKADVAFFRPSDGNWFWSGSSGVAFFYQYGQNGDQPIPTYKNKIDPNSNPHL